MLENPNDGSLIPRIKSNANTFCTNFNGNFSWSVTIAMTNKNPIVYFYDGNSIRAWLYQMTTANVEFYCGRAQINCVTKNNTSGNRTFLVQKRVSFYASFITIC